MTLLIKASGPTAFTEWKKHLAEFAPFIEVQDWHDVDIDVDAVRYVLVWAPEAGRIATFPQCRLVLSDGAGVDHLLADRQLPIQLPIVRMVTTETAQRMAEYVTMACYAVIRDMPQSSTAQRERRWDRTLTGRLASDTTVGIMGLGQLGSAAATSLVKNGFRVAGWSNTSKDIAGVSSFVGAHDFDAFVRMSSILVNLLPNTPETQNIMNADLFARLPIGASVINVGRGTQLDTTALHYALDTGHLRSAILDVFESEPLGVDDPLWHHRAVTITAHVASEISLRSRARHVASVIEADLGGKPIPYLYDRSKGY